MGDEMGAMKRMLTAREEDLRVEMYEISSLINDSIDRGEGAEERRMMNDRYCEVERKYNALPTTSEPLS